jgi:hypothetical protein
MDAQTRNFETQSAQYRAALRYAAAALAFISELIHLWVLPEQYAIWVGRGVFFFVVAACQGALAASLLFGPGRKTFTWGVLLNLFVVFVWGFTRVLGLPAWTALMPLPVGALDLTATTTELALVVLLVRLRRKLPRKGGSSGRRVRTLPQNLLLSRLKRDVLR